jgi:hypothetical protein
MRMSEEEFTRLDAVAKHYGLNAAGVLRMLVKREFDAIGAVHGGRASSEVTPKKKR